MVSHADDHHWAARLIVSAEAVLAGGVNLSDDLLILRDEVGSVLLVPLDPVAPQLHRLLLLKLPGDTEACYGVNASVELLPISQVAVLLVEDGDETLLVGLNLRHLTVSHVERVTHCLHRLQRTNNSIKIMR